MKTVNVQISDLEFDRLGLKKSNLTFSEFIEVIEKHITKLTLEKSILLSEKYGIENMTMTQINDEIKSLRDAKTDS